MDIAELKALVQATVDRMSADLVETSHRIHAHPELCYEERFAHDALTDLLERAGLQVTRHAYGLDTAFEARAGTSGPVIAVCCEYDALPEIGHACGHNIIATAGVGAGIAAAAVAEAAGGTVVVLGTPAEEGGGGKIKMARAGAFDGLDAAMMIHPADADLFEMDTIAIHQLEVEYFGEAAHAAAAPWVGRNALDAAVLGYVNVAALRQHIRPDERIHGIFTKAGDKPNIVPKYASAFWYVRAATMAALEPLEERVLACLRAGAEAAGCRMTHRWGDTPYSDLRTNTALIEAFAANSAALGRPLAAPDATTRVMGSTDMGNVSYLVPSIHPMVRVAPPGTAIHTPEFATWAASPDGDRAVIDGAKAMAMTAIDVWAGRCR